MTGKKNILTIVVLLIILGSIYLLEGRKVDISGEVQDADIEIISVNESVEEKAEKYEVAKEITTPDHFINTEPFKIADYIGEKVIVIDFWTYSCINCQRTLPYLNAWHDKYEDDGLLIVGVHTPEFEFEKELANVQQAVDEFAVKHPVVLDNDFSTWRSYNNRYWPRKYIIDIDGFIVYDHIGEGAYEETEKVINELLVERAERLGEEFTMSKKVVDPGNIKEVDRTKPRTPEIYFGASRNESLANGTQDQVGTQTFSTPEDIEGDKLYLEGEWFIESEYATPKSGSSINIAIQAKDVYMVARSEKPVRAQVYLDGELISETGLAGEDVSAESTIIFEKDRLYKIMEADEWGQHLLQIIFEDGGAEIFTFTFG